MGRESEFAPYCTLIKFGGAERGFLALSDCSVQRVLGNRDYGPWPVTNVLNAVSLINEATGVSKHRPAVVLAFVDITWWATSTFVPRDIHRCRSSLQDNEGVVHYDIFRARFRAAPWTRPSTFSKACPSVNAVGRVSRRSGRPVRLVWSQPRQPFGSGFPNRSARQSPHQALR